MATEKGVIKKTSLSAYKNVRTTGIAAITLRDSDRLSWVKLSVANDIILEISKKGQCIIYNESDVRSMGRSASGVRGMKLRNDDKVISMSVIPKIEQINNELIVILENGFGKRSKLTLFDIQKRGGVGIKAANVTLKTGNVVDARIVGQNEQGTAILVSKNGIVIRLESSAIKLLGRITQFLTFIRL